jgi:hypothetical protein
MYARAGSDVKLSSDPGHWSKIGDGAVVGRNSNLGNWSDIGHFARVGRNVAFGPWASIGIDAVVDNGCVLGDHEYVPSGHRRHRNGKLSKLAAPSQADAVVYRLFDRWATAIPSGVYHNDTYRLLEEEEKRLAMLLAAEMPAFLARRKAYRAGVGMAKRIWALMAPSGNLNRT